MAGSLAVIGGTSYMTFVTYEIGRAMIQIR